MAYDIREFTIGATRLPCRQKFVIVMKHVRRPGVVASKEVKGRVDALKIPDILCALLHEYEEKYQADFKINPISL